MLHTTEYASSSGFRLGMTANCMGPLRRHQQVKWAEVVFVDCLISMSVRFRSVKVELRGGWQQLKSMDLEIDPHDVAEPHR